MIVVAAECHILQDHWQDFEEQMNNLVPAVKEETGCLRYDVLTSIDEPGLFIILEEWESRKHLDDHLATSHMMEHKQKSRAWEEAPISLSLYEVSNVERLKL